MRNRLITWTAAWMIACAAALSGCATNPGAQSAAPQTSGCVPDFPLKDGWLGGDAVYALPLSETNMLWFFGDTFIGHPGDTDRRQAHLIANSVARSTCEDNQWSIAYSWHGNSKTPAPIFQASSGASYWPLSAFAHASKAYIILARIARTSNTPLGFRITGTDLAQIDNPTDEPTKWHITTHQLTRGQNLMPGIANVVNEHYIYLYTALIGPKDTSRPIILTRLAKDGLDSPALQTYTKGGSWTNGVALTEAVRIMTTGATEMSVRYLPQKNRYIAVMNGPPPFSGHAEIKSARTLAGPWSKGVPILTYPESNPTSSGDEQLHPNATGLFCYAAKEHPQFSTRTTLTLSYVCNADKQTVITGTSLYRPQIRQVKLP